MAGAPRSFPGSNNGAVIHLGGEYTWGDCEEVASIIERLIASGHLAEDGDYGDGTLAKLVVITDGAPRIENHVLPVLPWAEVQEAEEPQEASTGRVQVHGGHPDRRERRTQAATHDRLLGIRMMTMVGKWDAFWHQPDMTSKLAGAFGGKIDEPAAGLQEAA